MISIIITSVSVEQAKSYMERGLHDEAIEELNSLTDPDMACYKMILLSKIGELKGNFEDARKDALVAIGMAKDSRNRELELAARVTYAYVLFRYDAYDEVLQELDRASALVEDPGNCSSDFCREYLATLVHLRGNVYHRYGYFQRALQYVSQGLELRQQAGLQQDIAASLNKIAIIHLEAGEPQEAITYVNRAYHIRKELENYQDIAYSLNVMGRAYQLQGEFDNALECYATSLNINQNIGNDLYTSRSLFNLILLTIEQGDLKEAEKFSQLLSLAAMRSKMRSITHRHQIAKALILKATKRIKEQGQAQEIFQELIENPHLYHSQKALCHYHLSQILLDELKFYGGDEIFREIKAVIQNLFELASDERSYSILLDTMIIQSKLLLLEGNADTALDVLYRALDITEDKKLKIYQIRIIQEKESLEREIEKWSDPTSVTIRERIEESQINEYLDQVSSFLEG